MAEQNRRSIQEALRSDHAAIMACLDELIITATDERVLPAVAERDRFAMMLVRHFVAEEQFLYPAVRRSVPGGGELSERAFNADRECEEVLAELGRTELSDARLLNEIRAYVLRHIDEQEPVLQQLALVCHRELLEELGASVLGAEHLTPPRPRPQQRRTTGS